MLVCTKSIRTFVVLFCLAGTSRAASLNLAGKVVDTLNRPLAGVIVSLVRSAVSDTTNTDGLFSFGVASGITSRPSDRSVARWRGGMLDLQLEQGASVQVDVFDIQGARVVSLPLMHLEAGQRHANTNFYDVGTVGRWWCGTETGSKLAAMREMIWGDSNLYRDGYTKSQGFTLRCVKDAP